MNLLNKLMQQIPNVEYYPTKHKKAAKKDPIYLHISNHYFEKKDEETGVVSIHRVGIQYKREVAKTTFKT